MNMEKPYSNREIALMFDKSDAKHESAHQQLQSIIEGIYAGQVEILKEAKKTNGRVRKLENWKWMLAGMGIIISIFLTPLLKVYFETHL